MTAVTHVSDVCCVGLHFHTKGSDLVTDVQVRYFKFPHAVAREVACSHSIPACFVSCVKCCTGVLSLVTGFQELISIFFQPLKLWNSNLKTSIFALFWHLGTQRAHILQYLSLLWTVFMYSS